MKSGVSDLGKNIKVLRKYKKETQEDVAKALKISREAVNSYENNGTIPPMRKIIKIAEHFNVDTKTFLTRKLTVKELESASYINGVPAITVNSENEENIQLVEEKVQAGYIKGFQD